MTLRRLTERTGAGRPASSRPRGRARRLALGFAYWVLVAAISIALVIALLLFLESRDASQLREGGRAPGELVATRA